MTPNIDGWRDRLFLRAPDVAALLGVSVAKAYTALASGEIPGLLKIGGAVRVRVKDFAPWLDGAVKGPKR